MVFMALRTPKAVAAVAGEKPLSTALGTKWKAMMRVVKPQTEYVAHNCHMGQERKACLHWSTSSGPWGRGLCRPEPLGASSPSGKRPISSGLLRSTK